MTLNDLKTISINEVHAYKFSSCADLKPVLDHHKTVYDFLMCYYDDSSGFGIDNLHKTGCLKLHGWCFDFKPYLKLYVYKQYDNWFEAYAPNKTLLRKTIYGQIDKIVKVV